MHLVPDHIAVNSSLDEGMNDERLRKAISLGQQATEADREGDYEKAFDLYKRCLEHWQVATKYQTNPVLKEKLCEKMEPYMNRAEVLKKYLVAQNEHVKPQDENPTIDSKVLDHLASTVVTERPTIRWKDIAGLEKAKEALQEAAILPTRFPDLFVGQRKPWKGILLYGPPGTGKTHLARACAGESNATFISGAKNLFHSRYTTLAVSSADLISKWQGESEKLIRSLFDMARQRSPSIIFIDEVDSLCSTRDERDGESSRRIKTEFLIQMEGLTTTKKGVHDHVLVLGATNEPWALDAAIRRRFERRIYIPLPDYEARKEMLMLSLGETSHDLVEADWYRIATKTEGFSGADIALLVRDALFEPIRRCRTAHYFKRILYKNQLYWTPCVSDDPDTTKQQRNLMSIAGKELLPPKVTMQDFLNVLQCFKPSVGQEDLTKHIEWTKAFGLECH